MKAKGKLIIWKSNGVIAERPMDHTATLDEISKEVGGHIELVPGFTQFEGEPCQAYCNEEGKLMGLRYNTSATKAWVTQFDTPDFLVGNIVILTGIAMETDDTDEE